MTANDRVCRLNHSQDTPTSTRVLAWSPMSPWLTTQRGLTATIELLQQLHKLLVPEDHLRDSLVEILTLSSGQLLARVWTKVGRRQFDIVSLSGSNRKLQRTFHSQLANLARAGKRRRVTLFEKHGSGPPQQLSLAPQVADVLALLLPGQEAE